MKGRKIIILMSIMAVSIVGLVVTQFSLIHNVVSLSTERFDQAVNQAMRRTIFFMEEKEAMIYLTATLADQKPELGEEIDSLQKLIKFVSQQERLVKGYGDKNIDRLQEIIQREFKDNFRQVRSTLDLATFRMMLDSENSDLRSRIDFDELYDVLKNHLEINDIEEPFEYYIYDQHNALIYCSPLVQSDKRLKNTNFVYELPLFPNDLHAGDAHITVVFPTMRSEMLTNYRNIWPMIILNIVILLIFIFTVYTINRQRTINEMTDDFVNNMTHELKTPLASISLASQMLQDDNVSKTPERIASLSKIINDESRRLQLLVDKVLQTSTYEKHSSALKLTDLNINPILQNICKSFEVNVIHAGGQLITHLDAQDDVALIDQIHFTNIIYNLLDNAVKYRSSERPLIIHVITSCKQEKTIQIEIDDNGIGIAHDTQNKIFDKFFRVHTGNLHNVKGYGIGLSYVKRVVTDMQGTITVSSEPEIGTRFIISLPTL